MSQMRERGRLASLGKHARSVGSEVRQRRRSPTDRTTRKVFVGCRQSSMACRPSPRCWVWGSLLQALYRSHAVRNHNRHEGTFHADEGVAQQHMWLMWCMRVRLTSAPAAFPAHAAASVAAPCWLRVFCRHAFGHRQQPGRGQGLWGWGQQWTAPSDLANQPVHHKRHSLPVILCRFQEVEKLEG